ncbi:MAG: hypothetical protein KDB27_27770 [Planctomycetales bacterium]|nr:hypothetical protein [Planctomycetales bacterium]
MPRSTHQKPRRFLSAERLETRRLLAGDLNRDGTLDAADIDLLSAEIRRGSTDLLYDLNVDGVVDFDDHGFWVRTLKYTFVGDANLDGLFGTEDMVEVFKFGQFEDGVSGNSTWQTGDWNGDGDFDTGDFVAAFKAGGFEQGTRIEADGVVEWINPDGGSWHDPSNWSTGEVPTEDDDVLLAMPEVEIHVAEGIVANDVRNHAKILVSRSSKIQTETFVNHGQVETDDSASITMIVGTLVNAESALIALNKGSSARFEVDVANAGQIVVSDATKQVIHVGRLSQRLGEIDAVGTYLVDQGAITFTGGELKGLFRVRGSEIDVSHTVQTPSSVRVVGGGSKLIANRSPNVTVWIEGTSAWRGAELTTVAGAVNDGRILMQTTSEYVRIPQATSLIIPEGEELRNNGTIEVKREFRGERTIEGTVSNHGNIVVNEEEQLNHKGHLKQESGMVDAIGTYLVDQGAFTFTGGELKGLFRVRGSEIDVSHTVQAPSSVRVVGGGTILIANRSPNVTVWIEGTSAWRGAELTTAAGAVNDGRILMQTTSEYVRIPQATSLIIPKGEELRNNGTIEVKREFRGERTIEGTVSNHGNIVVNEEEQLNHKGHLKQEDGLINGIGSFTVDSGRFEFRGGKLIGDVFALNSEIDVVGETTEFAPSRQFLIDPRSTHLRTNRDPAANVNLPAGFVHLGADRVARHVDAIALDLATDLGTVAIEPGDRLLLEAYGSFCYTNPGCAGLLDSLFAVFSKDDTLLDDGGELNRVLGAVPVADGTFSLAVTEDDDGLQSDVPHDFWVSNESSDNKTIVTVPENATHLFVGAADTQWYDNFVPGNAGFGIRVTLVSADFQESDLPGLNTPSVLYVHGTDNTLIQNESNSLHVRVRADHLGSANLNVESTLQNRGIIELDGISNGTASLSIDNNATFVNSAAGIIRSLDGAGRRLIDGTWINNGLLWIDHDTVLDGEFDRVINNGTFYLTEPKRPRLIVQTDVFINSESGQIIGDVGVQGTQLFISNHADFFDSGTNDLIIAPDG